MNLFQRTALIIGSLGLAFGASREKDSSASQEAHAETQGFRISHEIPIEISENGKVRADSVKVDEVIPCVDHLSATTYISNNLLSCLENRTASPNSQVFYSAQASYLRNKQIEVMRNPESIEAIKKDIDQAHTWFNTYKDLPTSDFKKAFAISDLEVSKVFFVQR